MFKPLCISLCAALAVSLSATPALPNEADAPHIAMPLTETEPENVAKGKSVMLSDAAPAEAVAMPLTEAEPENAAEGKSIMLSDAAPADAVAMPLAEAEPENAAEGRSVMLTASFGAKPVETLRRIPLAEEDAAPAAYTQGRNLVVHAAAPAPGRSLYLPETFQP